MSQLAERTHIGAYVDAEQRRQLIELARRDDRSVSSVIRARTQGAGRTNAVRTLREVKTHPYAPVYGAQIADEEKQEGGASPLRPADDEVLDWARSFWAESDESEFAWDQGGRKVVHLESGETYKIRFGHPRGGELESDIVTFVVRDSRIILLGRAGAARPRTTFLGTHYGRKVEYAGGASRRRGRVTRRDDHVIAAFRSAGAMLRRGVGVRVPTLPSTTRSRTTLKLEANRDADVRFAYELARGQTAQTKTRQLQPKVLRRSCGTIIAVR